MDLPRRWYPSTSTSPPQGLDIEETALNTNLKRRMRSPDAQNTRHWRPRSIDFIDMMNTKNQRAVENRMRNALSLTEHAFKPDASRLV